MIVLKNDYFVFRFASRFFKRNYRFSKKWRVLRVYMNMLHLERPLRTFIADTLWRHSLNTKLYSEYILCIDYQKYKLQRTAMSAGQ